MNKTKQTRQLALLSILCPACASGWTVWIDRDLWECPEGDPQSRPRVCGQARHQRVRRVNARSGEVTERERPKVTYPWLFARPDPYGVVLTVWTGASVGRAEVEKVANYLANTWRCRRVHVEQRKPGRVTIRALLRDPLDARLALTVPHTGEERRTGDDQHNSTPQAA